MYKAVSVEWYSWLRRLVLKLCKDTLLLRVFTVGMYARMNKPLPTYVV